MQPKGNRVAVFFASVFAVSIVVVAFFIGKDASPAPKAPAAVTAVATGKDAPTAAPSAAVWQDALEATRPEATPGQGSMSDTLIAGIKSQYGVLTDPKTSAKQKQAIFNQIVTDAMPVKAPAKTYVLADLHASTTTDMTSYVTFLELVLRQSTDVREYEITTFERAIRTQNHTGSPELVEAATIYARIRDELVAMAVPTSVAKEHLALVNSLGTLAQVVAQMGAWNGDAALGLVFMADFDRAEAAMQNSMFTLSDKIKKIITS